MLTYGGRSHASSRIRALTYIPQLENTGLWKINWLSRAPDKTPGVAGSIYFAVKKRYFFLKRYAAIIFQSWDLVFIQRLFISPLLLNILRWKNTPVVFDFDDAIYLGSNSNFRRTKRMVVAAEKVIVSGDELGKFCSQFNKIPVVIPSPVDSDRIDYKRRQSVNQEEVVIGWIGSVWTQKYVKEIAEALILLSRSENVKLLLVGASKNFKIDDIPVEVVPWSYESEAELLHRMDIGIMPLPDNEWSRGKGGYKIYQYMASGMPVVASPVGINAAIVDEGVNGFLASTMDEWVDYLSVLISDPGLRITMGKKGRQKMVSNYSYKVCFPHLNKVLQDALKE